MSFHADFAHAASETIPAQEAAPRHVLVALPERHDVFSLAIVLDLLAAANHIAGRAVFHCEVASEADLASLETGPAVPCLVLIADARGAMPQPKAIAESLRRLWQKGASVGAWGMGVLALAEAGLLAGRSFALCAEARPALAAAWPDLTASDRSFCQDERVLTSVGKFILSDMILHLIQQACGRRVMLGVMDHCLIRRTPEETSPDAVRAAAPLGKMDPRIAAIESWIGNNIAQRFSARDVAGLFDLSTRHLERLFLRHLNRTPAAHIEHLRLSHAMRLMRETALSLDEIARATGHGCRYSFQRRFTRKYGIPPI